MPLWKAGPCHSTSVVHVSTIGFCEMCQRETAWDGGKTHVMTRGRVCTRAVPDYCTVSHGFGNWHHVPPPRWIFIVAGMDKGGREGAWKWVLGGCFALPFIIP